MDNKQIKPLCIIILLMIISVIILYVRMELYKNISLQKFDENNMLGVDYKVKKQDIFPFLLMSAPSFAKLVMYTKF